MSTTYKTKSPSATASWRDALPIHPAAELFPRMSPDELKALGEDIKQHGLTSPIALWRADPKGQAQLLDGRNRLDAIELVTGKPVEIGAPSLMAGEFLACDKVIVLDGKIDPYAYVVSVNIRRRHLNVEQRQDLVIKIIARAPEKSDRQIGEEIGVDHKTIARARAKGEDVGRIPHVSTRTDTRGRKQPQTRRATTKPPATGNPKTDADVQAIRDNAAEHIQAPIGQPEPPTREDIGLNSGGEAERLRVRNEELERENAHLRHEIEEQCEPALEAARCDICREKRRAMQRPVFVCDRCVETHGLPEIHAEAAPPDDGLDIPGFLDRTKQRAAQ